jgi:hypothetical protein
MYIPKKYGQSKVDSCPFCNKQATTTNKEGFPVCIAHKDALFDDMKCVCGKPLESRTGKYGKFFLCEDCGPISVKKVLEFNPIKKLEPKSSSAYEDHRPSEKPKEFIVRSDDPRFFS